MGFQGNLQSYNLADLFQNIGSNARTGTLMIAGPSGEKNIYFVEGQIRLLAHGPRGKGLLKKVVLDSKLVSNEQVEMAEKAAVEKSMPLLNAVLELGVIEETNLKDLVYFAIEEDIYELFTWTEAQFEFVDGPPDNAIFEGELFADENTFSTSHLVMEAARRSDEWQRIKEIITSDDNVFIIINEARPQLENFDKESAAIKVVMFIDGYRSIGEVIAAAGIGKFDVYEAVFMLYQQGIVRHKTFEELFQTGMELKGKDQVKKAIVFLNRALTMQHNPECIRNLAELYEADGDPHMASKTYNTLAVAYQSLNDDESALEAFRKTIELDKTEAEAHNAIAQILAARDQTDDAVDEYIHYAEKLLEGKQIQKSREICYRILNLKPHNYHSHRLLAKGYLWEGNSESAIAEYKSLAQAMLANMKPKQAIKEYAEIIEAECNFPAVKEGVKDFLLKSGEAKSYGLMRFLLVLVILVILGGSGLGLYVFYNNKIMQEAANKALGKLQASYQERMVAMEHRDILNQCTKLLEKYPTFEDIRRGVEEIKSTTEAHLIDQVKEEIIAVEKMFTARKFKDCLEKTNALQEQYGKKGYGFLYEQIEVIKKWEKDALIEIAADKIAARYREIVAQFEKGLWDRSLDTTRTVLMNLEPNPFSDEDLLNIKAIPSETDVFAMTPGGPDAEGAKANLGNIEKAVANATDVNEKTREQLRKIVSILNEMVDAQFDGKKMFNRYTILKSNGADEKVLKLVLDRAAELGSRSAVQELQNYDEMLARSILREGQDFENQGEYEKALRTFRRIMETEKLKDTETAELVKYFFIIKTDPEGVQIDINGRESGKTKNTNVYRYRPGDIVEVKLYNPTFKMVTREITPNRAVYSVAMEIGPEKTFKAKSDIMCELLISDDTMYFGDKDGFLYAVPLKYFTNDWDEYDRGTVKFGVSAKPLEYRDTIYFGTERGDILALSKNMASRWSAPYSSSNKSPIVGLAARENPIKMAEYLLFAATKKGEIIALDAETGEEKWKVAIPSRSGISSGIFVHETAVYTAADDGKIYGMDIISYRDGLKELGGARKSILTDFTFVGKSTVICGSKDKKVYAFGLGRNVRAGISKYDEFETRDWVQSEIYYDDGKLYVGSDDHYLYCLTFNRMKKMFKEWSFRASDKIQGAPIAIGDFVYTASIDGKLSAINTREIRENSDNAQAAWHYNLQGKVTTGLHTWSDYLLVTTEEGFIHAFKIK